MNRSVSGLRLLRLVGFAGVVAAVVAFGLFLHRPPFSFEVTLDSSVSGNAQLYYDVGRGIREQDSVIVPVAQGLHTYRFGLWPDTYRALRFDPSDQPGNRIVVRRARLIDRGLRIVRTFRPADFAPVQQIERFQVNADSCAFQTSTEGNDSILYIALDASPTLVEKSGTVFRQAAADLAEWFLVVLAAALFLPIVIRKAGPLTMACYEATRRRVVDRPAQTVCLVAFAATVLSCYPVVFCGKSLVSPNILGSAMLYPRAPFLPGYQDTDLEFPKGTDTGAMLWQNLPYSFIQSRALWRDHELPLWNRYNSAGAPLLAQGISMFGDPLHTIVLLGGGAAWAWDIKFVLAKALFCAAIGLLVLRTAKRLSIALALSASSAFIGFFSYRFDHPAFFSMCYAPWLLLAWVELARLPISRRFALWGGVLVLASCAEINSGGVKEGYMLLCSMHGTGFLVFLLSPNTRERWKKLLYLSCFGISFGLLSAPVVLPFVDTLKNSWTAYDITPSFQIQPGLLLGFFDEIFYRAVNSPAEIFDPSANFLILLGCLAALAPARRLLRDRTFVAVLIGALPCLALAFGIVSPAVVSKIPVLKNVGHLDNTFSCALIIHAAVLAGFGSACLVGRIQKRSWLWDYTVIASGFVAIACLYLGFTHAMQRPPNDLVPLGASVRPNATFYIYALSITVALLVIPLAGRAFFRGYLTRPVFVVVLTVCCVLLHWRFGLHLKSNVIDLDDVVMNPRVRVDLKAQSPTVDWLRRVPDAARTVGFGDVFFPGYDGISGIETISGTDPLQNSYYRDMLVAGGVPLQWMWRWVVDKASWDRMLPFYNLLNVRYFLATFNTPDVHLQNLMKAGDFDLSIYENGSAWPRAFFVDKIMPYDSTAEFIAAVVGRKERPFAAVPKNALATAPWTPPSMSAQEDAHAVAARNYHLTSNTTTFTIDAPTAGVVVLTEVFLPDDFVARINDAPAKYFRVNHAFRGMFIPKAGTYTISFSYWPRRFTQALVMAATGLVLLGACLVAILRHERRRGNQVPLSLGQIP